LEQISIYNITNKVIKKRNREKMIRVLEIGEIIKDGDEIYDDAGGQGGGETQWYPSVVLVGFPVTKGMWVRRPQKPEPRRLGSDGRVRDEYVSWCRENGKDPFPDWGNGGQYG
jgi:hypothetical protein